MKSANTPPDREEPSLYEISVLGKISDSLSTRFPNLEAHQFCGFKGLKMTSLSGRFQNQEDLLQVVASLHAMKHTVTSVEWLESL